MTPETIGKLEEAFAMDCTDQEACLLADISPSTLYDYQNANPEFLERKKQLKQTPFLKARKTVIDDLRKPDTAKWYLERKKKTEFASRQELTGAEGKDLGVVVLPELNDGEEDNLEAASGTADAIPDKD